MVKLTDKQKAFQKKYYDEHREEILARKIREREIREIDEFYKNEGVDSIKEFRNFWNMQEKVLKFTKSQLGLKPWNQGKTGIFNGERNPFYGKRHSEKTRKIMSKNRKGIIPWNKGHRGTYTGKDNAFYGKKHSKETIKIIKEKRLHQVFPVKDSKPEIMFGIKLDLEKIKYVKHKTIIGQPDFFIEPNVCVFVDGCFWHGCPDHFPKLKSIIQKNNMVRDMRIHHELNHDGFIVIRVWEHDIIEGDSIIVKNIINLIKQFYYGSLPK
jgi:DNA mismatch endonuclease Vsr